jgi:hypothetical protein
MAHLQISETRDHFVRDGQPFFYFADTAWLAFANARIEDWAEYLEYRRTQGFNALQLIVLPIPHDTSESAIGILPFDTRRDGSWDFTKINDAYFDRARYMLDMATAHGFIPVLAPLWCNYVEGSWASRSFEDKVMPLADVEPYMEYVVERFAEFQPVWIISGDEDFKNENADAYYRIMFDVVSRKDPDSLATMHLSSKVRLPDCWADHDNLGFYMYQSGHRRDRQDQPFVLAEFYGGRPVKRPVVNGEPCYEALGHPGEFGRYTSFDVRKAIWQSLLSGAKAGVAYGAHGIWSWHERGKGFTSAGNNDIPFHWSEALRLDGAWDAAFARWAFETHNLFDIEPADAVQNDTPEIRMARGGRSIVIYSPYTTNIVVDQDLGEYEWSVVGLANRRFARPLVDGSGQEWRLRMHEANCDMLFIGQRSV